MTKVEVEVEDDADLSSESDTATSPAPSPSPAHLTLPRISKSPPERPETVIPTTLREALQASLRRPDGSSRPDGPLRRRAALLPEHRDSVPLDGLRLPSLRSQIEAPLLSKRPRGFCHRLLRALGLVVAAAVLTVLTLRNAEPILDRFAVTNELW